MASTRKPLRRINQNVPGDLYDRLAETAQREDRTKSAILVRALEAYIELSEQTLESHTTDEGHTSRPSATSTSRREATAETSAHNHQ